MPKFCHVPQLCHSVSFCHAGPFLVMLSEVVIDKVAEVYTEETSAFSFLCCRSFDSLRSLRMTRMREVQDFVFFRQNYDRD